MVAYATLLRGINLGNHNKIAMPALRQVVEALGYSQVASYLQSGNLVFESELDDAAAVASALESAIESRFALEIPVVVRTHAELATAWLANPFPVHDVAKDSATYVCYLGAEPASQDVAALMGHKFASAGPEGDQCRIIGAHAYVYCPGGYGRTKLTNAFFERHLHTISTARNLRTALALVEMTGALATPA